MANLKEFHWLTVYNCYDITPLFLPKTSAFSSLVMLSPSLCRAATMRSWRVRGCLLFRPDYLFIHLQLIHTLVDPSPTFPLEERFDVVAVLVGPRHGGLLQLRGGLAVYPAVWGHDSQCVQCLQLRVDCPHTSHLPSRTERRAQSISSVGTGDTLLLPRTHVGTPDTTTTTTTLT